MVSVWLVLLLLFVCFTPMSVIILLYVTSFLLFLHKFISKISHPHEISYSVLQAPVVCIAGMYNLIGKWWHGYSVVGFEENLPKTGPALLVFYHAPLPLDMYYWNAFAINNYDRPIRYVGDRFLQLVPGFRSLLSALHVAPMTADELCQVLKDGSVACLSPGGLRECLFSDDKYSLVWNNRQGFARVWLQARVPIIPVFTVNGREAFWPVFGKQLRSLYERIRLPIVPILGGFPVKLTTIIGKPVEIPSTIDETLANDGPDAAAKCVADATAAALESLIKEHQRIPNSVFAAVCDRF